MNTDPIADYLTRLRNASKATHKVVDIPASNIKKEITKILKDEGFIKFYEVISNDLIKKDIKIGLKYDKNGNSLISKFERKSKPGKRLYLKKQNIPKVLNGFGFAILSTSKGIVSGKVARTSNVGGEYIGSLY